MSLVEIHLKLPYDMQQKIHECAEVEFADDTDEAIVKLIEESLTVRQHIAMLKKRFSHVDSDVETTPLEVMFHGLEAIEREWEEFIKLSRTVNH